MLRWSTSSQSASPTLQSANPSTLNLSLPFNDSQDDLELPPQSPTWDVVDEFLSLGGTPMIYGDGSSGTVSPSQLVSELDVGVVDHSNNFQHYSTMDPWSPTSWDPLPPSPLRRSSMFPPASSQVAIYDSLLSEATVQCAPAFRMPATTTHSQQMYVQQQQPFPVYTQAQTQPNWATSMSADAGTVSFERPFTQMELAAVTGSSSGSGSGGGFDMYASPNHEVISTMPTSVQPLLTGDHTSHEISPRAGAVLPPRKRHDSGQRHGLPIRQRCSSLAAPLSPEYQHHDADRVFPSSAPVQSTMLSKLSTFSPSLSSPRLLPTCASPRAFFSSPIPIQSAGYATSSKAPPPQEESKPSPTSPTTAEGGRTVRKRRRVEMDEDSSEENSKHIIDMPAKSDLKPPKQAPSMWQIYFADWLQQHKIRFPHDKLNVAQAAKEAGGLYKMLGPLEKEELKRRVQIEKDQRELKLQAWQRTLTPEDIKRENRFRAAQRKAGLSRRANIKDPNAPKKPLSAYFMFLAKIRSDPNLVMEVFGNETETTRQSVLAARRWREMSDEEKRPFLTQAEHDKIYYESARKEYEERNSSAISGSGISGTGYIIPPQAFPSMEMTTSIFSSTSRGGEDAFRMVTFTAPASLSTSAPTSTMTATTTKPIAVPKRRRGQRKAYVGGGDSDEGFEGSDDEWVPGRSA